MADLKISELSALAGADLAGTDLAAVVDNSASETKKITIADLIANGLTLVSDDSIPGAKILFGAGDVDATALATDSVTTAKIQNGAVTNDKIASGISDSKISFTGGSITAGALATDSVTTDKIANAAVTNDKLAGSIAGSKIVAGDIGATQLGTDAVVEAKIQDNAVTAAKLAGSIPGSKLVAGDVGATQLATDAVTTDKIINDAVTAAKIADESTVDLVTELPVSGGFVGQLALDTDDDTLYCWDGSQWLSLKAAGSINTVNGSTTGSVNIVATTVGSTVTISATLDDTTDANQFLAGPTGAGGAVAYRTITGSDIPVATTTTKGGVIVNGEGLRLNSNTIEIDNDVVASATHYVVTYDAKGLVTGGRAISSADLPIATSVAVGGVIPGTGLSVDVSGNLNHTNTVSTGTYTKVTVDAQGHVSVGDTLSAADIPDLSASKITTGTFPSALIANDAITATKLANESVTKFGGAGATDNVVTFPAGDFKGQFFYDEKNEDLYVYTGTSFVPITVISGNLINAGTYDASTNLISGVTTAGSAAGFTVGAALPNPANNNLNYYVVVDTSGTGSGTAPAVALAPPDLLISLGGGSTFVLIDVSNAIAGQTAANISVVPAGNISSTDVQAALQELDSEKLQNTGGTLTGNLELGDGVVIVFEGSSADDYETTITVVDPTSDRTITFPDVSGNVVTTGDTGTVTSTMIADGTIVNADINASAAIAVSKLGFGTARQLLQTNAGGTAAEFTSNVDIPGTLDVTGAAVFDSTARFKGNATFDGSIIFEGATADDYELTLTAADPTADVTVTIPASTTTLAGLAVTQSFTKAQRGTVVALADSATITPDFANGNNFSVVLGGNRTLANPSNLTAGQSGVIVVTQDGTGSRTLAYGSYWKFAGGTAPTLTTTASAVDVIAYYVESATRITAQALLNVS